MEETKKRTKSKYSPQNRYNKENTIKYAFRLNKNTDAELIEFFNNVKNKSGLIKNLLKEYLKNN